MASFIQQIIDAVYRHPKSNRERFKRFGGRSAYKKMLKGEQDMIKASVTLPPVPSLPGGLPVYFLTGKKYLHQTLFCIQSLIQVSDAIFEFTIVDDGSFDNELLNRIQTQLPGCHIVTNADIQKNLDELLPASQYPRLRAKREIYPHLRKLTDVHTLQPDGWKLILDSDMMFWDRPVEMIDWLNNPVEPVHMVDCVESYGYSKTLMEQLCQSTIPSLLNVGAIGLKSSQIDWAKLNEWIPVMEEKEGTSYYLEQALTAMLIGSKKSLVLDASVYKVNPSPGENAVILKHYVDLSKKEYFNREWRRIATT